MTTGTKSLLFGVHQFIWHPITVFLAWKKLYGWPDWKTMICIIIHDWGYWGSPNMDGPEGERHPVRAANIASNLLDTRYGLLCLYHSRHYAKANNHEPSQLCWADKLSIMYEPWWLYLPRAYLSGELFEYRRVAAEYLPITKTHREWFAWVKDRLVTLGKEQSSQSVPFMREVHGKE